MSRGAPLGWAAGPHWSEPRSPLELLVGRRAGWAPRGRRCCGAGSSVGAEAGSPAQWVGCAQGLFTCAPRLTQPWWCSAPSSYPSSSSSAGWAPTLLLPTAPQVRERMGPRGGGRP